MSFLDGSELLTDTGQLPGSVLRTRRSCTTAGPWDRWLLPQEVAAKATSARNVEAVLNRNLGSCRRAMRLSVTRRKKSAGFQVGEPLRWQGEWGPRKSKTVDPATRGEHFA